MLDSIYNKLNIVILTDSWSASDVDLDANVQICYEALFEVNNDSMRSCVMISVTIGLG